MILSLFLTAIFFFVLSFFGWQLTRYFLKESRKEYLIGFSGILGISFYILLTNTLGYFIPIDLVFYLVLFLFFTTGLVLLYLNKSKSSEWEVNKKWKNILLGTTILLSIISGVVYFRYPPVLHGPGGLPLTTTIAEGNFPPLEIWNPHNNLRYHYTFELLSAGIHKTTGVSIHLANSFQVALLMGFFFLIGFCFIKRFFDSNNFKAFVSSLMMVYAGSLTFLSGLKGIPILYNLYIRNQELVTPFKFITDSINSTFSVPVVRNFTRFTWGSLSYPLIIAIIYLYFHLINQKKSKSIIIFCGLLLAVLAMVGEVFFAIMCLVLFIYPFVFAFAKKDWQKAKDPLNISFWILLISTPLALVQGGFFRSILDTIGSRVVDFIGIGNGLFKVNEVPWLLDYFNSAGSPIFHLKFYTELAPLLLLLIPSSLFLIKKDFRLGFFLVCLMSVSFVLPLFLTYNFFAYIAEVFHYFVRLGHVWRFFNIVNLIGGLVVGLFLSHLYLSSKKEWVRKISILIIILFMTQGILFQLLYLTVGYPKFTWDSSAQHYPQSNSPEAKVYDWIKENTTTSDLFLITEKTCSYDSSYTPNYRFVLNTGRLAPIYTYHCSYPPNPSFKEIRENCSPSAIEDLKYSYLYINENWAEGLEEKCLKNNKLNLVFESGENRIYKVIWSN